MWALALALAACAKDEQSGPAAAGGEGEGEGEGEAPPDGLPDDIPADDYAVSAPEPPAPAAAVQPWLGGDCPEPPERFPSEAEIRARAGDGERAIFYVDARAAPGGDGSRGSPARSRGDLPDGLVAIVAWSVGEHLGGNRLGPHIYVGACAERTRIGAAGVEVEAAMFADVGDRTRVTDLTIHGDWKFGLVAQSADVELERVRVGPVRGGGGSFGVAIAGGRLSMRWVDVADADDAGIGVIGGRMDLEDVKVSGGLTAVVVSGGGVARVGRLRVSDVRGIGVLVSGGELELATDVTITDIQAVSTGPQSDRLGQAVQINDGGRAVIERMRVDRAVAGALFVSASAGADRPEVTVRDVEVTGAYGADKAQSAAAFWALQNAAVTLERVLVHDGAGFGIHCFSTAGFAGTELTLTDVEIRGQQAPGHFTAGGGVTVENGCSLTGRRVALVGNEMVGLFSQWGFDGAAARPTVELEDLLIEGTRSAPSDRKMGQAVAAMTGAQIDLRRALLRDNRMAGVVAYGYGGSPETRVILSDVRIRDTHPSDCSRVEGRKWTCLEHGDMGQGTGIATQGSARVRAERFLITGSAFAGIVVSDGAVVRTSRGVIRDNAIGMSVVDPEYDTTLLEDEVFVFDNGNDYARTELIIPTPEVVTGLEAFLDPP